MLVFEWARGRKFHVVVNNKNDRVFLSRNLIALIVAHLKFVVLKTSISTSNFRGQISADSSSTETLYRLLK